MSCSRFEELFIKEDNKELLEHIMHCHECRYEYEKMQKTENVLKEAKPFFLKQKRRKNYLRAVVCMGLFFILSVYSIQNSPLNQYNNRQATTYDSLISDSGVPVDEYGLVDID